MEDSEQQNMSENDVNIFLLLEALRQQQQHSFMQNEHSDALTGTRVDGSIEMNTAAEEDQPKHQEYDVTIFTDIVRDECCIYRLFSCVYVCLCACV